MHYVDIMQRLQTANNLNQQMPNLWFREAALIFLMIDDLLVKVSIVSIFHDDTEGIVVLIDKYFFIRNDVRISYTCQNTDFIDSI